MKTNKRWLLCLLFSIFVAVVAFVRFWSNPDEINCSAKNAFDRSIVSEKQNPSDRNPTDILQDISPDTFIHEGLMVHAPGFSETEVQKIMISTLKNTYGQSFYTNAPIEIVHENERLVWMGPIKQTQWCTNVFVVTFPTEPQEPGYFGPAFAFRLVVNSSFEVIEYDTEAN